MNGDGRAKGDQNGGGNEMQCVLCPGKVGLIHNPETSHACDMLAKEGQILPKY